MNTKKLKYIKYLFIIIASVFVMNSCSEDDELQPAINAIYSSNTGVNVNQGFPGDIVMAEGVDLQNVQSIVFDGTVEVIFNPVFNSNLAISFTVPFDETKGSKFGVQPITFTKKDGTIFESEFEILQPIPLISKFNPERPTIGTPVSVNGKWFQNVQDVVYQGRKMDFTLISSTELQFIVPADLTKGGLLEITTNGGTISKNLDIYLGFEEVLIADFDGGGVRPKNNWITYGDFSKFEYKTTGGISGKYAELTWAGSRANGYNGCQSDAGASMLTESNPEKVIFLMDVNANGAIGTSVDVFLADTDGVNWAFNYVIKENGWQTIQGLVADFGKNYDPSNQSNGDANPVNLNQVKVSINQNAATPNPSIVQFDNLRWQVYETVQPSKLPPSGPQNILLNSGLELGDGNNFENWGMWNGADRMSAESTNIHGGSRALKVVNPAAGNSWDSQFVSDPTPTVVGKEYIASMWVKGDAVTVRFSTNANAGALYGSDFFITSEWKQVTWEFTANDASTRLVLDMGVSKGTFYVDDIELKEK